MALKPRIIIPKAKKVSLKTAIGYWGFVCVAAAGGALFL